MKRLTLLTVIAMMTVATSSGCRTCGSLFGFGLGNSCGTALAGYGSSDSCSTCDGGSYDTANSPYGAGTIYEGDMLLPPVSGTIHGPAPETP